MELAFGEEIDERFESAFERSRPTFENLRLLPQDIDLLRLINEKHEVGNAARNLLAIAAFHAVLTSTDPAEAILNMLGGTWDDLTSAVVGLRRVEYLAIARDCATQAAMHQAANRRTHRDFWTAMYEFYRDGAG